MRFVKTLSMVKPRPFSTSEYYLMADHGMFHGERVELLGGAVVAKSPHNPPHCNSVTRANGLLVRTFGEGYLVRCQLPLSLGEGNEPEPDFAVVTEAMMHGITRHPTRPLLVIEVSDSSLGYDRKEKGSLYAAASIQDYWIVNLVDHRLERYTRPRKDARAPFGWSYAVREVFKPSEEVAPLAEPERRVQVGKLY